MKNSCQEKNPVKNSIPGGILFFFRSSAQGFSGREQGGANANGGRRCVFSQGAQLLTSDSLLFEGIKLRPVAKPSAPPVPGLKIEKKIVYPREIKSEKKMGLAEYSRIKDSARPWRRVGGPGEE
jgi:hypothetical protein